MMFEIKKTVIIGGFKSSTDDRIGKIKVVS
jgi:hypothetical protein